MTGKVLRQKVTAAIALVAVCLTLLPVNTFAAIADEEFTSNGYRYVITSPDTKTVAFAKPVNNVKYSGEITVPAAVKNGDVTYSVTEIQADAFLVSTGVT